MGKDSKYKKAGMTILYEVNLKTNILHEIRGLFHNDNGIDFSKKYHVSWS